MGKRDDILDATLELIDEEGLQSVTFAKIFKRANVGSGTLYNYFKNKDEIVATLFTRSIKRLEEYELPEGYDEMDIFERFNGILDVFVQFMLTCQKEYMFLESFNNYKTIVEYRELDNYYGVIREFNEIIEAGQNQGIFRQMDVRVGVQVVSGIVSTVYKGTLIGKYEFDEACKKEIYLSCWKALLV